MRAFGGLGVGQIMNPTRTLFYDVDTQRDFLLPEGKLHVSGAERILPQLERLTTFALQQGHSNKEVILFATL
jgi:hypothetical protein